ncbi:hypothetical protein Rhe02_10440 [Rhizocola hellebori]|uniref:Uncharacterized protein n=1 Tax=Rhizocola hellebori TaxID=1392758 RepID=A0A8J3Q428_9ACTN|nr:hypothetical protein Rhe02_10440 [Rhizocola hellebori]
MAATPPRLSATPISGAELAAAPPRSDTRRGGTLERMGSELFLLQMSGVPGSGKSTIAGLDSDNE